ncbi:VWA domain-containing protein [Actomonas aquatica]|uniref:VWA domain-containing protein n=1 Tax=Actomonas aquatica TaxID=2866162 RepID=A0ABZ1C329_9BACT|nr:VWA domain-containing protein [Opitutus sp. WL0086]WRQ85762.1 VWA domain-containing protein [Opitutus sp. WL0086]
MSEWWTRLATFEFAQPWWLLLLLALIPWWRRTGRAGVTPAVSYSSLRHFAGLGRKVAPAATRRPSWLPMLAVVAVVVALAGPRIERGADENESEGIDVMLVLDASRSMDSADFDFEGQQISRRAALERVIGDFIAEREQDRIGIVAFAEQPYLISPLTLDHGWMMEALTEMKTALGTALGSGVEAAVDLLRQTDGGNRVIIAVTDGLNTGGTDPLEAARLARSYGVRLYTIAVVSYDEMQTGVDDLMLSQMARLAGGQFFQAADGASLESIYDQIDQLERQEFKRNELRAFTELFPWAACAAMGLVMIELAAGFGGRSRAP